MKSWTVAQPDDVLCGPFRADAPYYVVLLNLERFYWDRPPMSAETAQQFLNTLGETALIVEWRCSTAARLPTLVIVGVDDAEAR